CALARFREGVVFNSAGAWLKAANAQRPMKKGLPAEGSNPRDLARLSCRAKSRHLWIFLIQHRMSLPAEGLEPTRPCGHWILSPARLPIPPRRQLIHHQRFTANNSDARKFVVDLPLTLSQTFRHEKAKFESPAI